MRKTLLLSEIFPPRVGGSGRWFWEIYSRFAVGSVLVAAGRWEGDAEFDTASGLPITRLPLTCASWGLKSLAGARFYLANVIALRRLVRAQAIDEIHCGRCLHEGFAAYLVSKLIGLPYICYVHGEDVEAAALSREHKWMASRALNGAKLVVCNSQNTASIVSEHWLNDKSRMRVLNPGVDTQRFVPAPRDLNVRGQLGWSDRPVILTVGRLQRRKGQDMLLRALPDIVEQVPNVLYAIVGHGKERERLQQLVVDLNLSANVTFMSEIPDETMIECYQQCDVFALPNRTEGRDIEGFGMVLVEAQACGRPVLAGDSGGTAETMLVGESGLVVDCTRPAPLAHALNTLLQDPDLRQAMGEAGRAHVTGRLDWSALASEAQHVFNAS